MDTLSIIALVFSGLSVIIAIISIVANLLYDKSRRKKDKRGIPSVAVWFDYMDDIDKRLNNDYRWYVDIHRLDDLAEYHYCYFNFTSTICKIYNCHIEVSVQDIKSSNIQIKSIDIGTIRSVGKVVPVEMIDTEEMKILCTVTYDTEENEHLMYNVEFAYNVKNQIAHNRRDVLYKEKSRKRQTKINKQHYKYIATYNQEISENYKSSDLKAKLEGKSLNKMK